MSRGLKWLTAAAAVFAAGVAAGSFAAVKTAPESLYNYFAGLSGGGISIRTGTAVITALAVWSVLFFSAFFKFGTVTTALAVGARGFVDGYSVTSILRILGFRGLGLCFFDILGAPCVIAMAASVMCALLSEKSGGAPYLARSGLLLLIMIAAAAAASAISGAVTGAVLGGMTL